MSLDYLFPVFCRCKKTGRVTARRMRLRVEYDRATGAPRVTLHASALGTPANVHTLDPTDEAPTSAQGPAVGDAGMQKVEFMPTLPCDGCDSECTVFVNIRYRHPQPAGGNKKKKKARRTKPSKKRPAKQPAKRAPSRTKPRGKKAKQRRSSAPARRRAAPHKK